jgi:hypothetical protein
MTGCERRLRGLESGIGDVQNMPVCAC